MRALVTGAGGFVGAHLASRLAHDGWDVAGVVRPGGSRARLVALGSTAIEVIEADLADPEQAAAAVRAARPDIAFLLAAARAADTPAQRAMTAAVNGVSNLWQVDALPEECRAVVRIGSSTEYAAVDGYIGEDAPLRPASFFGATKAAGSVLAVAAAARRRLRSAIVRPFQIYGPLDHAGRLVPTAMRAARDGRPLPLTAPGRRRDWVFVDDVVECCVRVALADHLPPGQVVNAGTGRQAANEEVVDGVAAAAGTPIDVRVGAHPGRDWDTASWVCDPTLARTLLGWEAKVDLAEGLARCWVASSP